MGTPPQVAPKLYAGSEVELIRRPADAGVGRLDVCAVVADSGVAGHS